jgi:hypothetical protein
MAETHSSDKEGSLKLDRNDDAEQLRTVSQEEEQCEEGVVQPIPHNT